MKHSVALIYGGEGKEREISRLSAKNLASFIDKEKFLLICVYIAKTGDWFIESENGFTNTFPILRNGVGGLWISDGFMPIDVAIPALHGDLGEDGVIVGLLRAAHIRYVGCDTVADAVTADKIITKSVADALNIPTAKWIFSAKEDASTALEKIKRSLSFPIFIKPALLGSSIGVLKVNSPNDFKTAFDSLGSLSGRILIEESISVKAELECAYLEICSRSYYSVGAVLSDGVFYGFEEKYEKDTKTTVDGIDPSVEKRVIEYSKALREAIGIKGVSRLDFFLTENGDVLFNEINSFPGMTSKSLYPLLTEKMGFGRGEFINLLISEMLL